MRFAKGWGGADAIIKYKGEIRKKTFQRTEVGGQRTEVRSRRSEDGGRRTEVRGRPCRVDIAGGAVKHSPSADRRTANRGQPAPVEPYGSEGRKRRVSGLYRKDFRCRLTSSLVPIM